MSFSDEFIKKLLIKTTARKSLQNARKFYYNCIKDLGYISEPNIVKTTESYDDPYSVFLTEKKSPMVQNIQYENVPELGFQESQHIKPTQRFNRTFIGPSDQLISKRLVEVQKWVSIDPQELELRKVSDIVDTALNGLGISSFENISRTALNMYWNIMEYYKTNELKLKQNKGVLKLGYIIMVIYYSLLFHNIKIELEKIISAIPDARISYIPEAESNIKFLFADVPGYTFLYNKQKQVCFIERLLSDDVLRKIEQVKKDMVNSGLFGFTLNKVQNSACIYYICSVIYNKGGVYSKRANVILPDTGIETMVTANLLSEKCGPFSAQTLTNEVFRIVDFYKKNKVKKDYLNLC